MKHEQSVADRFNQFMAKKAAARGCRFEYFSLDGQDCVVGGDYVLTDAHRFSIVEFKDTEQDIKKESRKRRRLSLCKALQQRFDMVEFHDQCHFIVWSALETGKVHANIYRHEVCNLFTLGAGSDMVDQLPFVASRVSALKFVEDFFHPSASRSLTREAFQEYLEWLLVETSESSNSTVELVAFNPDEEDLVLVRFSTLEATQDWLLRNYAPPTPPGQVGQSFP